MGLRNLRAICPNCGGKIHTQAKGLGHISWANSWIMVKTGTECQHCGIALTGKVKADGKAQAVDDPRAYGAGPIAKTNQRPAQARVYNNQTGKTTTVPTMPKTSGSFLPAESEGWWPDPAGRHDLRYFSGSFWTNKVASADGAQTTDPTSVATAR